MKFYQEFFLLVYSTHQRVAKLIKGWPDSVPPEKVVGTVDEQLRATMFLPYVHGVSDALKRVSEPFHIRTFMKPYQTL